MKKVAHYVIRAEIELLTGMRIGGSDDVLQIGGTDLTCIIDPSSGQPYIPGSSLKGRMRSGLERVLGAFRGQWNRDTNRTEYREERREPCGCARDTCAVCRVFGPHKNTDHKLGPTRLIIRDGRLANTQFTIENKTEATIRRDTNAAEHPRTVERVAPGARFSMEAAIQEYDIDKGFKYTKSDETEVTGAQALIEIVDHALWEMEQTGLGGGTGKGYGQIKIHWDGKIEKCHRTSRAFTWSEGPCIQRGE